MSKRRKAKVERLKKLLNIAEKNRSEEIILRLTYIGSAESNMKYIDKPI